jgi:hypothetical protein
VYLHGCIQHEFTLYGILQSNNVSTKGISSIWEGGKWVLLLTRVRLRGGYFDPTRIHFSAVGIFLGIITSQFTYLLLHSSPFLRCHWHFLRTAGIRDNGRKV